MARELATAGIATTLISDAAVFAMMARVNKVLLGAYAILADGGCAILSLRLQFIWRFIAFKSESILRCFILLFFHTDVLV